MNTDVPVCRICHEDLDLSKKEDLLAPCACKGSIEYVHRECFTTWGKNKCDMCHFNFFAQQPQFVRQPQPQQFAIPPNLLNLVFQHHHVVEPMQPAALTGQNYITMYRRMNLGVVDDPVIVEIRGDLLEDLLDQFDSDEEPEPETDTDQPNPNPNPNPNPPPVQNAAEEAPPEAEDPEDDNIFRPYLPLINMLPEQYDIFPIRNMANIMLVEQDVWKAYRLFMKVTVVKIPWIGFKVLFNFTSYFIYAMFMWWPLYIYHHLFGLDIN
jgi:hypothetical protein